MVKVDIHDYKKRVDNALKRIRNSDFSEKNKKDIFEFYDYLEAEALSEGRIAKYMYHMLKICEMSDKNFEDMDKKDVIQLVRIIERRDYTRHTKHDYKIVLKRFFHWLRGMEDYPKEVRWIKSSLKKTDVKLPEELLDDNDIKKLVDAATHPRDKAMVSFLFESGCRVGELLSIQLKNLTFDEFGCLVTLTGKTGMRKIRVVASVPHLSLWLENHPFKGDKQAPLWAPINDRKRKMTINYPHINGILKNLAKKSGMTKRVNPHNFRHSRATQMANHLTEAQMDNYFGWVQGSKMPSIYVHLSGRDMDNAILKMNGIKVDENKKPTHFAPKVCFRCEKKNPPTGDICVRCGAPLNVKAAIEAEEKKKRREKTLAVLLRDPETRQFLYNKMQNIKEIEWYRSTEKSDSTGTVSGDLL